MKHEPSFAGLNLLDKMLSLDLHRVDSSVVIGEKEVDLAYLPVYCRFVFELLHRQFAFLK